MSESTNPNPADQPGGDETFTWTQESGDPAGNRTGGTTATAILDSVRDVVDDLAERAGPTVRELSARAAELTAIAADKAAPLAKRAGEVTADASGKLASRSREWASELRSAAGARDNVASTEPASTEPASTEPASTEPPSQG